MSALPMESVNKKSLVQSKSKTARRRRSMDRLWWSLCAVSLLLVVVPVFWVLISITRQALPHWQWSVFTENSTGVGGGLLNAIVGTTVISVGTALIAGLVGIGCGIYLSEFTPRSKIAAVLRGAGETLAGIPSIVFGYCGYLALVIGLHWGFSLLPALAVLSLLVVPYIAKSTELALQQVPLAYREGAEALGMTMPHMLRRIVIRPALPGILTGIILAVAISVGETAPLIYTANFSNNIPSGALIHEPVGYLTYAVWTFYDEPIPAAQHLASDAALILAGMVLGLILVSRLIVRVTQRYSPDRQVRLRRSQRREAARAAAQSEAAVR